jgi:signal transduction histidine kinase
VLGPVYVGGVLVLVMLSLSLSADLLSLDTGIGDLTFIVAAVAFVLLPYLFLGGLLRSRVLQAGAVGGLVSRLAETPEPDALREALAAALRDDSLALVYWLPEERRYVDQDGRPTTLPEAGSGRTASPVEHDGHRVAAIVHADLSDEDTDLIGAVGAAAGLALENERLSAELRARVEELRASRQRIVEAGVAERRRLERDLHDGAQQRLVSLALTLRMTRTKLRDDPAQAERILEQSGHELDLALEELRELARGIHPAVLSDRGLEAALQALASRAPFPVELLDAVGDRVPDAVESAAYFVVSEALTNAAKYADATHAKVVVEHAHGWVLVAVSDDGVGGADPGSGTGLSGLADRLNALDGRLEVDSAPGRGTTVRARIPCA